MPSSHAGRATPRLRATLLSSLAVAAPLAAQALLAPAADARVTRFVVESTRPFAAGHVFGDAGTYERLDGTAYMEVDPADPRNAVIVNLDKAPRNARGLVEYTAPFVLLRPTDLSKGNDKVWIGLNNRGNQIELGQRTFPATPEAFDPADPLSANRNNYLLEQGYVFVDVGWHGDVNAEVGVDRLDPDFPVATNLDGSPIVGQVRIEYSDRTIPQAGTYTLTLEGSPNFTSYPTSSTETARSTLTVRDDVDAPKTPIPADRWAFGSCPGGQGSLVASDTDICLFEGFDADRIYELTYPARDPMVMGLAYAVTRDVGSFLRGRAQDDAGNPNPAWEGDGVRRLYGSGTSSTGMYMRDFLYLGFNEDEAGAKVFDAVTILIPGTHRLFANVEFADPNTYSREDDRRDFLSTTLPPYTYAVQRDPVSGVRDGILKRPATDPLVIHADTANEFWNFRASLNAYNGWWQNVQVPDNVRFYLLSSFSHGGGSGLFSPPQPAASPTGFVDCENLRNGGSTQPTYRALAKLIDDWADRGIEPPRSRYPSFENKTLVTVERAGQFFPDIPGVAFPTVINGLRLLDFGPEFGAGGGRQDGEAPEQGAAYPVLVPKPDRDGLDIPGIRTVEVRAPLGTNTGWNLRAEGNRQPHLCGLSGSFIPFAETRRERLANGDPRRSLEERYGNHFGFVYAVRKAASDLAKERFLLPQDVQPYVDAAEASDVLR